MSKLKVQKAITAVVTDFHQLAAMSDDAIIDRFLFYCRNSRKRILAKEFAGFGTKVQRDPELLTIALRDSAGQPIGTFSFAGARFGSA